MVGGDRKWDCDAADEPGLAGIFRNAAIFPEGTHTARQDTGRTGADADAARLFGEGGTVTTLVLGCSAKDSIKKRPAAGPLQVRGGGRHVPLSPAFTPWDLHIFAALLGVRAFANVAAIFLTVVPYAFPLFQAARLRLGADIFADIFGVAAFARLVTFARLVVFFLFFVIIVLLIMIVMVIVVPAFIMRGLKQG